MTYRAKSRLRALPAITAVAAIGIGLVAGGSTARGAADVQGRIASKQAAAQSLRAAIATETARIRATTGGLQAATQRLAAVESELSARVSELVAVQQALLAARDRLTALENRLGRATRVLSANLVATYENDTPDLASVIVAARGFDDLLNRLDDLKRVAQYDARVLADTRTARTVVTAQAMSLSGLETRDKQLADAVLAKRTQAAALQAALLNQQIAELRSRSSKASRLHGLESQVARLQAQTTSAVGAGAPGAGLIHIDTAGMVHPPPGAPAAVGQVMAAGNAIAGLPYLYGGGHGSFHANAYDCSGSVSYALAAAGLVSAPLTSGEFETWGQPGPGRWITVYANPGHVYMEVAGWRFDTVALAAGSTRWSQTPASSAGYVARHPSGL